MYNQNPKLQKYNPTMTANEYYTLDTTISPTQTAVIPALNGRVGDNMRAVPIAFVDGNQPHDLTNSQIELRVMDANGVIKVSDKVINLVDAKGGLVLFGVPSEFYEAVGEVQRAYFVLKDKDMAGDDQTISAVNVDFYVDDAIDITKKQSSIYISALDKVLQQAGNQNFAVTDKDNKFTCTNTFQDIKASDIKADTIENDELSTASSLATDNSKNISTLSTIVSNASVVSVSTTASNNSQNILNLSGSVSDVSSSVSNVSTTLSTVQQSADTRFTNIESNMTSLTQNAPSTGGDDMLNTDFSELSGSVYLMSETLSSTASTADKNEQNLIYVSEDVKSVSSSITNIQTSLSNDEENMATNTTQIEALSTIVSNASVVSVSNTVDSNINSISSLASRMEANPGPVAAAYRALTVANDAMSLVVLLANQPANSAVQSNVTTATESLDDATSVGNMLDMKDSDYNNAINQTTF